MFFDTNTAAAMPAGGLVGKIDELIDVIKSAQGLGVLLTGSVFSVGAGGIATWRKLKQLRQDVEENVAPIKHEVSAATEGQGSAADAPTLRKQVDDIAGKVNSAAGQIEDIQIERAKQHQENSKRLEAIEQREERIEQRVEQLSEEITNAKEKLGDDVREVRVLVQKVLSKMAGV